MATVEAPLDERIARAVELLGPTVEIDTATLFSAAGAIYAASGFLDRLLQAEEPPLLLLDTPDVSALSEAFRESVELAAVSLLEPLLVSVPEEGFDDDPRVIAHDEAEVAAELSWIREIEEKFKPEYKGAALVIELLDMAHELVEDLRAKRAA
jgi:hypothetical protein